MTIAKHDHHVPVRNGHHLRDILPALVTEGIISRKDMDRVLKSPAHGKSIAHPFLVLSEARLTRATPPHDPITVELLLMWLAKKTGLVFQRIDPLKVDVSAVTSLVPYAYLSRHKILPVEVSGDQVIVATADPFVLEWEEELERILKKKICKVLANPDDISRYLIEFYALTESVKRAFGKADDSHFGANMNLEQMIELGRTGKLDANDRYVVNIVDWLLQYAYDQRASDIHLEPRREDSDVRFRIDGVLHRVYQLPTVVMGAVISRLKVLGRMDLAEKTSAGRAHQDQRTGGE